MVNGAQTVSSLTKVVGTFYEDNLRRAFVAIRVVEVPPSEQNLARSISRFTNTQNQIAFQDFAFLDEEQHRLLRELKSLGYEYLLRTGENVPENPALAIDAREAAIALACCQRELSFTVMAKSKVSLLFTSNAYKALFNPSTDPLLLLRSVLISRATDDALALIEDSSSGLRSGIAAHAGVFVTHVLIREFGVDFLSDPSADYEEITSNLPQHVTELLTLIEGDFPKDIYPGNVFKNLARSEALLTEIAR